MFQIGDTVIVPGPTSEDTWTHGDFPAKITKFCGDGEAIVIDDEDHIWQIECLRLKAVREKRTGGGAVKSKSESAHRKVEIGGRVFYQGRAWRVVGVAGSDDGETVALEPDSGRILAKSSDVLTEAESQISGDAKSLG